MALYIWSAQPAVRDKYVVYKQGQWQPHPQCPRLILHPEEPENPGYHGWGRSLRFLAKAFPTASSTEMVQLVRMTALVAVIKLRLEHELEFPPEIMPRRLQPLLGSTWGPNAA